MITSASRLRLAAMVAVLASSLLHVGAMAIAPELAADIRIAGSETEQSATLGNNFADLVKAGDKLDPAETDDASVTEPEATPLIKPVRTDAAKPVTTQAYAAVATPEFKVEPSRFEGLVPPSAVEKLEAIKPEPVTVQPRRDAIEPVEPKTSQARIEPVKTSETVTPVEEPGVIPTPTPKPKQRVAEAKKIEKPTKVEKRNKATSGNKKAKSKVNNRAGSQNAKKTAKTGSSGKSKKKSSARNSGNAAASNYPGEVYSKIARTRQRNAGGRGVANVRFNIASSGRAVSVSIARSSGDARIDRAAVAHVKRASPFPKPPPGAQTRYVIPIEFRR